VWRAGGGDETAIATRPITGSVARNARIYLYAPTLARWGWVRGRHSGPAFFQALAIAAALFPSSFAAVRAGTVGLLGVPATPLVRLLPAGAAAEARPWMRGPEPVVAAFEQTTPVTMPRPLAEQVCLTRPGETMTMTTGH
jgi:hypothetical protein